MTEYIGREAFIESKQHLYCENCARRKNGKGKFVYEIGDAPCRACDIMDVIDAVEDFPAADVRPVVLCRDCMLRQYCKVAQYLGEDGFCSNAVRRNEGL